MNLKNFSKDDILEAIGLQARNDVGRWIAPMAIGLGVGALIGASVALLVSPRSGPELREDLKERGRRIIQRGKEQVDEFKNQQPV